MDEHEQNSSNGHHERQGHWVSDGGRLQWIPARNMPPAPDAADDDEAGLRDLDNLDEASWASDSPPLPAGAPESARVRAALAWLHRMRDQEREIVGELALIERDQLRQQDAAPQTRRPRGPQPPNPITLDLATHGAAANWYDAAHDALVEENDRSSGRALVEWYLWLLTNAPMLPEQATPITVAQVRGEEDAHLRTRRHAEYLALPEMDDEE